MNPKAPCLPILIALLHIGTPLTFSATFQVTVTNDAGAGSLRQAILDANATAGPDTIAFNIAAGGLTIFPASALPVISEAVTIDGSTQPGFAGAPLIELAGASAGAGANGLHISAGGSTVRGLVINRFTASGLRLSTNGNNVVEGCYIGTGLGGTNDLGNTVDGIVITTNSANNVIGGTTAAARNVISGNNQNGVHIIGPGATNNLVVGNIIGLGLNNTDQGNTGDGVRLVAPRNRVGGPTAAERNVISGNNSDGIEVVGTNAPGCVIQGNYLGTDTTGTIDRGNGGDGILVSGAPDTLIGGTVASAGNLISGNGDGVELNGLTAAFNRVLGNRIGTDASGALPLPNGVNGVLITSNARTNNIGGVAAGEANLIAFNTGDGVNVATGTNNLIRGNLITANGNLGIDLGANGVQTNDVNDVDAGANQLQNYPFLAAATTIGGNLQIVGGFQSRASTTYFLDFYANYACDPSTNGEGQQYLGSASISTDANGNANLFATIPATLTGRFITATATDPDGNTSEFSPCVRATVTTSGNNFVVSSTNNAGPGSLRQAILDANAAITANDTITFNIPGAGMRIISPTNTLPLITDPVMIDGYTQPGSAANASPSVFTGLPLIQLDGALAGAGVDGLRITAGGSTIRGLVITRFTSDAIEISTNGNNVIEGCLLGIDTANTNRPNTAAGVHIITTAGNRIGGATPAARNVISGNTGNGVHIENVGASNNVILGNLIGPDLTGTIDRGNGGDGVQIDDAPNNVIGGATAEERNIISGNNGDGIQIGGGASRGNQVLGNFVGTDVAGMLYVGNNHSGVLMMNASGNTVGGSTSGARNLISGNAFNGVLIEGAGSSENTVYGNLIGTDLTATMPLGNGLYGVSITSNARNNRIGGVGPGEGNVVAYQSDDGMNFSSGANNAIRGNLIFNNGGLGIDLLPNGVTTNDLDDVDGGANQLQNFPVLTAATNVHSSVTIAGTLNGAANTTFNLDFFATINPDRSGHGEGEQYLGSAIVTTDGAGNGTFLATLPATLRGRYISATATDPFGNTSEFSAAVAATSLIASTNFVVTTTADSGPGSLRDAIMLANSFVSDGNDIISFNIPGPGPHTIAPTTTLPWLLDAATIDGYTQHGASVNTTSNGNNALLKVIVSGASLPPPARGLVLASSKCVVRGLSILGFSGGEGGNLWIFGGADCRVEGCFIGLEPDGTIPRVNGGIGIRVYGFGTNLIGGLTAEAANVISGNGLSGIFIEGSFANRIQGNLIASNGDHGVYVSTGEQNIITANSIHSNTNLGIELGLISYHAGVTYNDILDLDGGANGLQNFPVLDEALGTASNSVVVGTLSSMASQSFRLEFFENTECDPSNFGEGRVYLGFLDVNTDPAGNAAFTYVHPSRVTAGHFITATATTTNGSTSEFSQCVSVFRGDAVDLAVTTGDFADPTPLASNLVYSVTVQNNGPTNATGVVVTDQLPAGVTFVSASAQQGSCNQAAGVVTCNLGSIARGGSTSVTITVRPTAYGQLSNHVSVVSSEFDHTPENNADIEFTQAGLADMVIAVSANPDPVVAGQLLTFTVTAINLGPDPAPAASLFFSVDDAFCAQSAILSQGTLTISDNFFRAALGMVPVNGSATLTVTGVAGIDQPLFSSASANGGTSDPNSSNNSTGNSTTVLPGAGLLRFEMANFSERETNGLAVIRVIRTGGSSGTLTAQYATTNDTALAGSDYTARSGTLTFGPGVLAQQFTVPLLNDALSECNETVGLRLFNGTGGGGTVLCAYIEATLTITDDDGVYTGAVLLVSVITNQPSQSGGGFSGVPTISADGRFVAFQSSANDLVAGDNNSRTDVFLRDLLAGTTRLISRDQLINDGFAPGISGNGSNIVFSTSFSEIGQQLFVHIGVLNTNQAVTVTPQGDLSSQGGQDPTISSNGTVIAFQSFATDLVALPDLNGNQDVFARDLTSQTTVLVSVNQSGTEAGNGQSYNGRVSADGRYVAFLSNASDLVANDTNNATDVFLRDLQSGTTILVSRRNTGGGSGNADSDEPDINADGRYVAFTSFARDLIANDDTFSRDIYLFDRVTGTNRLVSVNRFGTRPADGNSRGPSISANGRYIAFESAATNLVANDINGELTDIYVRDVVAGTTILASLDCAGVVSGNDDSYAPAIAGDGRSVAFLSRASDLTSGDFGEGGGGEETIVAAGGLGGGAFGQLFRRDLSTNRTELLSRNIDLTGGANGDTYEHAISFRGTAVAFSSYASDLVAIDNNFTSDVFAWSSSATPPEPVPTISITRQGANQVTLSWPSPSTGFNLESTGNLNSPIVWTPVNATVSDNGLLKSVTLFIDLNTEARFFRLRK